MSDERLERPLYSETEIAKRVEQAARKIARGPLRPEIAAPILVGGFIFAADLLRALAREGIDLETEFLWLRSYGRFEQPGEIMILKGPAETVRGKTVLLIDGVLESGGTLARAKQLLAEAGAASVISIVAVRKPYTKPLSDADYVLFEAGPDFVYGYGMDRAGLSRGLPDIRARRP
jgi:hypoxanthine phosphoribosyltransferase